MVDIRIRDNGPYLVREAFVVLDADGNEYEPSDDIALCRCGHSNRKPFCDATHRAMGFKSAPRAATTRAEGEAG